MVPCAFLSPQSYQKVVLHVDLLPLPKPIDPLPAAPNLNRARKRLLKPDLSLHSLCGSSLCKSRRLEDASWGSQWPRKLTITQAGNHYREA